MSQESSDQSRTTELVKPEFKGMRPRRPGDKKGKATHHTDKGEECGKPPGGHAVPRVLSGTDCLDMEPQVGDDTRDEKESDANVYQDDQEIGRSKTGEGKEIETTTGQQAYAKDDTEIPPSPPGHGAL